MSKVPETFTVKAMFAGREVALQEWTRTEALAMAIALVCTAPSPEKAEDARQMVYALSEVVSDEEFEAAVEAAKEIIENGELS